MLSNRSIANTHNRPSRHGSSIVEMVVLMSVIGLLLIVSAQLMVRAVAVHKVALNSFVDVQTSQVIEDRLRSDLARSRFIEMNQGLVILTVDHQQNIKYGVARNNPRELIRQVVQNGKQQAIDRWTLPHPTKVSLKSEKTPSGQTLARLAIESRGPTASERAFGLEVVGVCDGQ